VTENLILALTHIQDGEKTCVIWVDAVCINQEDEEEKGAQVQRMGKIYGSAALTIVWLGQAEDDSDLAIHRMHQCINAYGSDQLFRDCKMGFGVNLLERVEDLDLEFATEATEALFQRPWFRRVWVTQEVLLATEVIFACGDSTINRTDLGHGFFFFMGMALEASFSGRLSMVPLKNILDPLVSLPLKELLSPIFISFVLGYGQELRARDPRDFVYGLIGMISDAEAQGLRVDYSKSVESVYSDFAKAIVQIGRLDCLYSIWTPYKRYNSLPSWVPDWSSTSTTVLRGNALPFINSDIDCSGEVRYTPDNLLLLAISGHKLDQIQYTGEVFNENPNEKFQKIQSSLGVEGEEVELLIRFLDQLEKIAEIDEAAELANRFLDQLEKFAEMAVHAGDSVNIETLSCLPVSIYGQRATLVARRPKDMYFSYLALRRQSKPSGYCEEKQESGRLASKIYLSVLLDGNRRQPFLSYNGVLGIHLGNAQPGDWLCSLKGSAHPWILREAADGYYQLIGRAVLDTDSIEGELLQYDETEILLL
jgi:hypothetical protein